MSGDSRNYENFLQFRRQETSNLMWVSRQLNPQLSYKQGLSNTTPSSHKRAVLKSPKVQDLLEKLSKNQNVPISQLEDQVRKILDEIGYNKKLKLLRWLGLIATKIYMKVYSGIYVNVDQVQQIKNKMGNRPVIFVPSHRSYGDFILMAYLCFTYDIAIPAVAAGMDFHGMWGMGTMLRDTGAFFMRRTYNNDSLYWTTFRQYVYQLVTKGDLPIEFFIEGTRSRSSKSLMPKFGLMAMVLKALFFAQVPDILFVPISINYDRILEESLFAYELLGVPKPKESTSGFFKSLKILKENFGNIYVHMDEPLSAREFFGNDLDRSVHNVGPQHLQEITETEKNLISTLTHEILYRQQKSSIITIFNLMSLILNNILSTQKPLLTIPELTEEILLIKQTLEDFGAFVRTTNIEEDILDTFLVHKNLIELTSEKRVGLVSNQVTLDVLNPVRLKAHSLSDKTMTRSVPFVMLQIYVNPTLQYLIDAAILVIILSVQNNLNKDELFNSYHFLRSLFSMEFVIYLPRENMEFENALRQSISLCLIKCKDCSYQLGGNEKLRELMFSTFRPFLLSYFVTIVILQKLPEVCEEKSVLSNVQKILESAINDDTEFVHPYCLNLDSLDNCLKSLCSLEILEKSRRDNKAVYEINAVKLSETKKELEIYIPKCQIDDSLLTNLHLQNKL